MTCTYLNFFRINAVWKNEHLEKANKNFENTLHCGFLCKEEVQIEEDERSAGG
jgi:hypothetical protein